MGDLRRTIFEAHRTAAAFLVTDLDLAMTFLDVANTSHNPGCSQRNQNNARTAYDTVLQFLARLSLTEVEQSTIREKLSVLRIRLQNSKTHD
jgi:hypothetical protein